MQQLAVPRQLERYVKTLRIGHVQDANARYRRLPDGETELMVSFGDAHPHASLIGTRTRALDKPVQLGASAILVRFRRGGAHPFFGRPLSELTNEVITLDALWSVAELAPLTAADGAAEIEAAVVKSLLDKFATAYEPAAARSVRRALRLISESSVLPRVPALAAELGVSERQLRRGFDQVVGMSPKHYLRVVRFQRALRLARASRQRSKLDWAAIAESCGYFDQAHLIAEFREMSGVTPSVLLGPDV